MKYLLEHLAVGNAIDAQNAVQHFDAFLNVAAEIDPDPTIFDSKPYLKLQIHDMMPIPAFRLMEAADFIDQNIGTKRILVFCDGGVGRSPSVAIAYLCSKGMRFGQAVEFVAMRKPFMSILPDLIESIRKAFIRPPAPRLSLDTFALPSKPAESVVI